MAVATDLRLAAGFTHLRVHSSFSFLTGANSPEELVEEAVRLGYSALALTDHQSLTGTIRFQRAAEAAGLRPIVGADLRLADDSRLLLLPEDQEGYRNLVLLLTAAHRLSPRERIRLPWSELPGRTKGLIALAGGREGELGRSLRWGEAGAWERFRWLRDLFGERFFLAVTRDRRPGSQAIEGAVRELGERLGRPTVAVVDVHYRRKSDFWLYDLLSCVRTGQTLEGVGPERPLNAEEELKSPFEMAELFRDRPEDLRRAGEIAERCRFQHSFDSRLYPSLPGLAPGEATLRLRRLVAEGVRRRYPRSSPALRERVAHELRVIEDLGFEDYFLVVEDVVRYARREGIRVAGRGSAADSVVAYVLGLTEVDSFRRGLLFERFLNRERAERPDIDLDIDARYRDRVADYLYRRYGVDRVAGVATYQTYRARSAVHDLGLALGFELPELQALARRLPPFGLSYLERSWQEYPELKGLDPGRWGFLFGAVRAVEGHPRFFGTHLGGLIIGRQPLAGEVPLLPSAKGPTIAAFDKDDLEDLGYLKLDLLSLRALSVLSELGEIPIKPDDPETYAMLQRGESIGTFQLESPAQRALAQRLRPDSFEDIIHSLALVRPGPIQGNMVDPFIDRRRGTEPVSYPHPSLEPILGKTFGVVLFQEQVIEIATQVAGLTPGEADRLRRVMSHARSREEMNELGETFRRRAGERGLTVAVADRIFETMAGYASYGFCEAHAAAFAETAYKSAYLLRHAPAAYLAALLSQQPAGYYPPLILAAEAQRRGIRFLPLDVNHSQEAYQAEAGGIRLGLQALSGWGSVARGRLLQAREARPFSSLADFLRRAPVDRESAATLILAGAFDSLSAHRRRLLLELDRRLAPDQTALELPGEDWPDFSPAEKAAWERRLLGLERDLGRWPLSRPGGPTIREVSGLPGGRRVSLQGLPFRPHRPPTRSGRRVAFLTLMDETGFLEVTVFEEVYQRDGAVLFGREVGLVLISGQLERGRGGVTLRATAVRPAPSTAGQRT